MDWIFTTINWYIYLLLLGLIAYPVTKKIFHSFFDKGYPFAKAISILGLSYITFILGIYKILPFTQTTLVLILAVCTIILMQYNRHKINKEYILHLITPNRQKLILILEEAFFFASLLFLTYIRGQEPSIRGLEKFMDYGFINSILRSRFFPPLDIWYSGGNPINYYYFGHLIGAVLIKLTDIQAAVGYNLILSTIFALSSTMVFSFVGNCIYLVKKSFPHVLIGGLIGSYIVNLAGNLHTIYLFTQGYNTEQPVPFWNILSSYSPTKYWYPNATRFIPFTIHEFPSYSYVVADLHGHVFDIPLVLLTLVCIFLYFITFSKLYSPSSSRNHLSFPLQKSLFFIVGLGALTAVHYMTNAFDGPIYLLLIAFFLFVLYGISRIFIFHTVALFTGFIVFSAPFSSHFSPFVSGIGLNCSPDFLVSLGKLGPFLFEKGNCQPDPFWMLFILWGFFWIMLLLFLFIKYLEQKDKIETSSQQMIIDDFAFVCFTFGTILVFIPEFFYIKDIYPAHFRANTMFKLGYQAFIIMGLASGYTFFRIITIKKMYRFILLFVCMVFFSFIFIYPFYSFPSYYGDLKKTPQLNGIKWLENSYPEDKEIIEYLNEHVKDQPVILEAQGDSYTDYERISAYTGLPTVAGWWVHEWLWRGSSDIVGKRIPDIIALYESDDLNLTKRLLQKYEIKYVIISKMEREKYKKINEGKFEKIGTKIFSSSNGFGALYQIDNK